MALSPMMQQYLEIKEEYKDSILFFRLGDFYEMFFDDAIIVSKELDLVLTGRNCGMEERAPMCGVPFHSADEYITRLVNKNYKVAICEQVEDATSSKGIVKREVTRVVTPGTVVAGSILKDAENNFLASIFVGKNSIAISYGDISTGEVEIMDIPIEKENEGANFINQLVRISPKEIIINEKSEKIVNLDYIKKHITNCVNIKNESYYGTSSMELIIKKQLEIENIHNIQIFDGEENLIKSLGGLFNYMMDNQKSSLGNIKDVRRYTAGSTMLLDQATVRNLEILENINDKNSNNTLLWVLDKTKTAMGGRKIKKWLKEPLKDINEIEERLDAVDVLVKNYLIRNNLREHLKHIYDFDRLASKISYKSANGKDLIALLNSVSVLPDIRWDLLDCNSKLLKNLGENIDLLEDVNEVISNAIVDEPPFSIREGGIIKDGYSDELDEIKESIKDAKIWLGNLENTERERTGISNLKVGYNRVFGYYIDITKSHLSKVPENYIRKQTLSNSERYITAELKETETLILNAESKINKKEYEIFIEIRDKIEKAIKRILETSSKIAILDVLISFAHVSSLNDYVRPVMTDNDEIIIKDGRHPVVEKIMKDETFVPNDLYINREEESFLLITGPNMAGKSTYMRQVAIIVLMAQAGCFIPAREAKIGVVDRIFTRIGASDNLAGGQSTFYVEMNELAYILNNQTNKSLVILDEIGRGTSTYDGLSIAWAVSEYLCQSDKKVRTLFASHYHELTALEDNLSGFKNLSVDVVEENDEIVFLHKIVEGSASKSYGIHVAKIAGVPKELLDVAEEKLKDLERNQGSHLYEDGSQIKFNF